MRDEVTECCRQICTLIRKGYQYREIAVETGDIEMLRASTANVLENVTLAEHPRVKQIKETLQRLYPDRLTLMSGSGPTVYTIFTDRPSAEAALERAKSEFAERW